MLGGAWRLLVIAVGIPECIQHVLFWEPADAWQRGQGQACQNVTVRVMKDTEASHAGHASGTD